MKNQHIIGLSGLVVVCIVAITWLGFMTWELSSDLEGMKVRSEASEKTPPVSTLPTPWNNDWSLSDHLSDLQKHMDEMMSTMSPGTSFFNKQGLGYSLASPSIEMKEKSDKYEIIVKVPEGQEMEINTALKASNLTISGRIKNKVVETQEGQSSRIFQTSQFSQSVYLSEPIDESGLRVKNDRNQFVITIPKV